VTTPIWLGFTQRDWILPCILLVGSVVIWLKHRENFVRMWNGTEIGLMAAFKGEHRVKK
jgi:glycerol-3-phosphate acyltransferase PlsY